MKFNWQEV